MRPSRERGKWGRALALVALVALVVVAMTLSSQAMAELRRAMPMLSRAMSWLEGFDTPFDLDHVAFFMLIACLARLLLRVRWWWIVLAIAALAAGTEFLQFWVDGRTPKLLDARDDLIGGVLGLLLGAALRVAWRLLRHGRDR
ncbi:MAG: VanZ family protein [Dokdonella sp.]